MWSLLRCRALFFQCADLLLDLHSFPTRRSSDLDSEWRQTPPQQSSAGGCLLPRGFGRYRSKSIVNMRARPQVFLAAQNAKAGGQRRVWFVTVTANEDSVWGRALVRRLSSSRRSK